MNSLLVIFFLAVIGLSQGAPQAQEAKVEVVEAAPVVDDGTVSTALTEGDSLPWTEFFSEAYTGLINTMTSLDLTNLDFNYEKTLDRLQDSDGSIN